MSMAITFPAKMALARANTTLHRENVVLVVVLVLESKALYCEIDPSLISRRKVKETLSSSKLFNSLPYNCLHSAT